MLTNFDKALVAVIMSAIALVNLFGFHFGLTQDTVTTLVALATPVLVHFIPNLPKDPTP